MIDPRTFVRELKHNGICNFYGVPDSLLGSFLSALEEECESDQHFIMANEGMAVSAAAGFQLATGSTPLVYMQNSGLGNAVNPLLSIAARDAYSIPIVLLIGWRGELDDRLNQVEDEPQHLSAGRSLLPILQAMDIPAQILEQGDILGQVRATISLSTARSAPVALIARKNTFFRRSDSISISTRPGRFSREKAIQALLPKLTAEDLLVATTGFASREVHENRALTDAGIFLNVGGMGHALSLSFGIASSVKERRVWCLDGDGAMLMHLGGLVTAAQVPNLHQIVINNGVHESVGGQARPGQSLDLSRIGASCGFPSVERCRSESEFLQAIDRCLISERGSFTEVLVETGFRSDLGRPKLTLGEMKIEFMRSILGTKGYI